MVDFKNNWFHINKPLNKHMSHYERENDFFKTILTVTMATKLKIGKFGPVQGIDPRSLKI